MSCSNKLPSIRIFSQDYYISCQKKISCFLMKRSNSSYFSTLGTNLSKILLKKKYQSRRSTSWKKKQSYAKDLRDECKLFSIMRDFLLWYKILLINLCLSFPIFSLVRYNYLTWFYFSKLNLKVLKVAQILLQKHLFTLNKLHVIKWYCLGVFQKWVISSSFSFFFFKLYFIFSLLSLTLCY